MSVSDRLLAGERVTVATLRDAIFRAILGDRTGAVLVLVTLVWVGLTWRLGFASNDQYTFANTVLAVADGQLHITQPTYGPDSGATPGTYLVDGRVYGRNYGIVVVSTLWYVLLRLAAVVADVRVLLTGLWSLMLLGVCTAVGDRFDRPRLGSLIGAGMAAGVFGVSLLIADPLPTWWLPLLALQITTALATAVVAVVCYRLVARIYDRRLGVAAGVATVVGTPVGFWATLPKRHSVAAMLVVCAMYTLYRSRTAESDRSAQRFRAVTYAWSAILAWVHAPLAFLLLMATVIVDLPTARSNSPRELLTIGAVFGLALTPFLITNALISGNPIEPPRLLTTYTGNVLSKDPDPTTGMSGAAGSTGNGSTVPVVGILLERFVNSYTLVFTPGRLFRVFVHTGYVPRFRASQDAAINLSVLASMPLLGALLVAPLLAGRRALDRRGWSIRPRRWSAIRVLDTFTVLYCLLLFGLYLESLPLHHTLTVRYLHPLYPIGVYWLIRLPPVRRAVSGATRTLALSYGATVLVLVPAYLAAIAIWGLVLGESIQLYAWFALAVAALVAIWSAIATLDSEYPRSGAVVLGVATGTMSVYLLVSGLALFPETGEFLLPVSRLVSGRIHYARLLGSSPPFWDATQLVIQPTLDRFVLPA